jgi:uncharacterized protein
MFLLDVNILVALSDADHAHYELAVTWLSANAAQGWATCPLTENGMLRILGHPNYPMGSGSPAHAAKILLALRKIPGHQFWADDFSLLDAIPSLLGVSSGQLTDLYLLALAQRHRARFATLDKKIKPAFVPGGDATYYLVT